MLCTVDWTAVSSWMQAIILLGGFIFTICQIKSARNDARAQFWLEIKTHFYRFDDVTTALRPGGEWESEVPDEPEAWSRVDEYLSMFEYCEMLLERKVIDFEFFKISYSVQLGNAMNHPSIRFKVNRERKYWTTLLALCKSCKIVVEP